METKDVYQKYTKYEVARILGARALQISMNAPLLLNISKEKLEEIDFNPLKIAEMEFEADILPITVKRPLPEKAEREEEEGDEDIEIEEEAPAEKVEVAETPAEPVD
jgi:DNA-directed RNA polymerase subunit K